MTPAARASAAIEVLADIAARKRPAADALKDWGLAHRFAGSGDRAAIGNLVFDSLRKRASFAYAMGDDSPRALVLRTLVSSWGLTPDDVAVLADGGRFAPPPLTPEEIEGLKREIPADAPVSMRGDFPAWLEPQFERAFGIHAAEEGAAPRRSRARRPQGQHPEDHAGQGAARASPLRSVPRLRIRRLACVSRQALAQAAVPMLRPSPPTAKAGTRFRTKARKSRRCSPAARPKQQILDLCAGAGGKTLGLAAIMENTGQLYAYDADRMRLRPIFERLKRAGVRNAQVLDPGDTEVLAGLEGKMDRVVVDAPCTGSGVWRRRPDAKWRLSPQMLEARLAEQTRRARSGRTPGQAWRQARLYHLLGAAAGEPGSGRSLPLPLPAVQHRALAGLVERGFAVCCTAAIGRRLRQDAADDAADLRHRRVFCRGIGAKVKASRWSLVRRRTVSATPEKRLGRDALTS